MFKDNDIIKSNDGKIEARIIADIKEKRYYKVEILYSETPYVKGHISALNYEYAHISCRIKDEKK